MHTVLFKRQLKPLDHFRYLSKSVLPPFLKKNKSTMFLSLSSSKPNSKHYCETTYKFDVCMKTNKIRFCISGKKLSLPLKVRETLSIISCNGLIN